MQPSHHHRSHAHKQHTSADPTTPTCNDPFISCACPHSTRPRSAKKSPRHPSRLLPLSTRLLLHLPAVSPITSHAYPMRTTMTAILNAWTARVWRFRLRLGVGRIAVWTSAERGCPLGIEHQLDHDFCDDDMRTCIMVSWYIIQFSGICLRTRSGVWCRGVHGRENQLIRRNLQPRIVYWILVHFGWGACGVDGDQSASLSLASVHVYAYSDLKAMYIVGAEHIQCIFSTMKRFGS